jgi:outer membrane protein OmpA-like peptidoglycan-associated protein
LPAPPELHTSLSAAGGTVHTGFIFAWTEEGLKLGLAGLIFQPNRADLVSDGSETGKRNADILSRILPVLEEHPEFHITIVGHAVNTTGTPEEESVLKRLSLARAQSVKDTLVGLGLDPDRVTTAGRGASQPLVPDTDKANNWKNRRVEFLLTRK